MPTIVDASSIPAISYYRRTGDTPGAKAVKEASSLSPGQAHEHSFSSKRKASAFANTVRNYIAANGLDDGYKASVRLTSVYIVRL